ncbi:hypothetical protein ACJRO7_033028 [Eucalyptus globulus]|uniref:Uncharacterized protein n=1 Tax=Eucalyptus globulus TaxID=34317 RepID=A0ABD3JKW6_EUCGL
MKKKKKATAEFSNHSDTDDLAVEDLISRTKDLYVLEQIAMINGSSFTADDSHLPFDLEFPFPSSFTADDSFVPPNLEFPFSAISNPSLSPNPNYAPEFELSQDEDAIAVAPTKGGCIWCSPKKPTPRLRLLSRGAIKKGMSMSFKWMEEDEGIVGRRTR